MKRNGLLIWSFLCAVAVLLFTTRSSPLFVINNWDDVNSYFTMGKGMMNGLVIYRDLYDQKGPFLYLLYGLAYLISNRSFLGVFLFEIIAAWVFLYFSGRFIERKSCRSIAFVLIPVLGAAIYSSWSFYWGGAAEEFCLPMLAITLYGLDELLSEDVSVSDDRLRRLFLVSGLCAGVVAQVKYTMLGFYFAYFVVAFIWLLGKRGIVFSLRMAVRFVCFALIPSVPWIIYFLITGSLDDWFRCYIYNNLFFYSQASQESYSLMTKLYEIGKTLYFLIEDSFSYFVWIIFGIIASFIREKGLIKKLAFVFMFASTYFVIFIGGNKLAYYSIPLMVFAIPGMAYLGEVIQFGLKKLGLKDSGLMIAVSSVLVVAASALFAANNTMNAEYRKYSADDMWLFDAAKELSKDDTLFEVNGLDAGLYTITGIVPSCEYFQTNGIGLDKMFEEQEKYIKEGRTDYVLAIEREPEFINLCYDLVSVYHYNETGHEEVYYLYRRK